MLTRILICVDALPRKQAHQRQHLAQPGCRKSMAGRKAKPAFSRLRNLEADLQSATHHHAPGHAVDRLYTQMRSEDKPMIRPQITLPTLNITD